MPASIACTWRSITPRRSTWCRCPGVYLGAVARATKRMRLGPLVYLLPLYSPLRLIEEICMLDHLSHGRMEVGVGRGVSPFELKYHKIEHEESRDDLHRCVQLHQRRA